MARLSLSTTIGGRTISGAITRTEATEVSSSVTVAAAKTGSLSTRTDANTGTLTMDAGHGFTDGQIIDVYWTGGSQRNVVIGTVSVNSVPIDTGVGDDLPAQDTDITACVQVVVDVDVAASTIELAAACATAVGTVQFQENDSTPILALPLGVVSGTSREAWAWASGVGIDTPFGANVGLVALSNGDSSASNIISFGLLSDNDT